MRIILAIEASHRRGMGHLFRGMRLGNALRDAGNDILFVTNPDERSEDILAEAGFSVERTTGYGNGRPWESAIIEKFSPHWWIDDRLDTERTHAKRLMRARISHATFDDHGTGAVLARFNFLAMEPAPERRAPNGFYGPDYMILDHGIGAYQKRLGTERLRIAVTLGGSDTYGVTPRAVRTALSREDDFSLDVVTGPNFRHKRKLSRIIGNDKRITVHDFIPDLYELLASSHMVICGAGVTLYEAACLGIPAVVIANEPHEVPVARWFTGRGFGVYAGFHGDPFEEGLQAGLTGLIQNAAERKEMALRGKTLVDGKGLSRVVKLITGGGHG